jgi:hypothetical protein
VAIARSTRTRRWSASLALAAIAALGGYLRFAGPPSWVPSQGSSAVGVLLHGARRPFCTASVVNSPRGDLIITAAHCLGRKLGRTVMFAPNFRDGRAPFGEWHVSSEVFPAGWFSHRNVNQDFAFLTVRGDVQARAGAERLGYSSPVPASVFVEAYSLTGRVTICMRKPGTIMADGQAQLRFACPGFWSASSGGPFLTDINPRSGLGEMVGIIGGYQQGGASRSVSYSSPFGVVIHALYADLTNAARAARRTGTAASR